MMMKHKGKMLCVLAAVLLSCCLGLPQTRLASSSPATSCIGGKQCNECTRGSTSSSKDSDTPKCSDCGECFSNWDRTLADLLNQTTSQVNRAEQVRVTGAAGAYARSFEEVESELRETKHILRASSITSDDLASVQSEIDRISAALHSTTQSLDGLDSDLANVKQSILQGTSSLDSLRSESDKLRLNAQGMRDQTTQLQEANIEGALNITREAKRRSEDAAAKVRQIQSDRGMLVSSDNQRQATEKLMNGSRVQFSNTQDHNQEKLQELLAQIDNLEGKIPELNRQVCDGQTSVDEPCDDICGGAGCGKCGGLSCLDGALSKAEEALNSARLADESLVSREREAEQVLREIARARQKASSAGSDAQKAFDATNAAKNQSEGEMSRVDALVKNIDNFTGSEKATPENVQKLADECMASQLAMAESDILQLGQEINVAISSVTNVDQILADTTGDLRKAEELKARADFTRKGAGDQLRHAEAVSRHLGEAAHAQSGADASIHSAQQGIDSARRDLSEIGSKMGEAIVSSSSSVSDVGDLSSRHQSLQTAFIKNENRVNSARAAAGTAKDKAGGANAVLHQLNAAFKNVSGGLQSKTRAIGSAKDMAVELQRRANELATSSSSKLANINDVEKELEETERRLLELSADLLSLNCEMTIHLQVIEDKSNFFRTCSPPATWAPASTCQCMPGAREPSCNSRRPEYEQLNS